MNEEVVRDGVDTEEFVDETLVCKECGKEFVFTAGEQRFFKEKGFMNKPKSCKACRDAKKNAGRAPREYYTAVCANCGGEAKGVTWSSPYKNSRWALTAPICGASR